MVHPVHTPGACHAAQHWQVPTRRNTLAMQRSSVLMAASETDGTHPQHAHWYLLLAGPWPLPHTLTMKRSFPLGAVGTWAMNTVLRAGTSRQKAGFVC